MSEKREKMRKEYARNIECPKCGERAVRNTTGGLVNLGEKNWACDACDAILHNEREYRTDEEVDIQETYEYPLRPEGDDESFVEAIRDVDTDSPDLTPRQKSKSQLSKLCFALAFLSGITIIGLPIAALFLILGLFVSPSPDDSDQ
jgi:transcription elongation factor Elf1